MQYRPDITRNAVADHLPRGGRDAVLGAARALAATLLRIWAPVTPVALFADAAFEPAWPALLFVIAGAVLSAVALARTRPRPPRRLPVANLSAASNCVWKMDVEG